MAADIRFDDETDVYYCRNKDANKDIRVVLEDGEPLFNLRDIMRLLNYADTTPHSKLGVFSGLSDEEKISITGEGCSGASFLTQDALIKCLRNGGSKKSRRLAVLKWLEDEVFPALVEKDTPKASSDGLSPEVVELASAIEKLLRSIVEGRK